MNVIEETQVSQYHHPEVSFSWAAFERQAIRGDWVESALCSREDLRNFFHIADRSGGPSTLGRAQVAAARVICGDCPVSQQCLDHAISARETGGVWGGLTDEERIRERYRRAGNKPGKSAEPSPVHSLEEARKIFNDPQMRILRLLALGLSDEQIRDKRGITELTFRQHRRAIREALGAETDTDVLPLAREKGLIK